MATTQSKNGGRFDEECKREVAALASRPGATDEQVGRDLGVSAWSVARWRRCFGTDKSSGASTPAPATNALSTSSVSGPELERQIKALQRENADWREQRSLPLKKSSRHLLGGPARKIGVSKALAGQHSVRKLCRPLGVARRACYAAEQKTTRARARARENRALGVEIQRLFEARGRTYGSPRLTLALRRAGQPGGRRRVARLMRKTGLRARPKRRFRPRTTDSRHLCPIAPNQLAERIEPPTQPNEVWPADITCVAAKEGWRSGAGVLDACSRKIVGRAAADSAAHRPGGACFRACRPDTAARRRVAPPLGPRPPVRQRCLP